MKGPWKQVDITRVLRAAQAAGLEVAGFKIDPQTGKIEVVTGKPASKYEQPEDLMERL
jgi:hypothetical protein